MSRQEAIEQYERALKAGKKYYSSCVAQEKDPYPLVLDEILKDNASTGAVNLGLVPVICKGIAQKARPGQTLTVDLEAGTVTITDTGEVLPCEKLGEQAMNILEAGGIKPMMRKKLGL